MAHQMAEIYIDVVVAGHPRYHRPESILCTICDEVRIQAIVFGDPSLQQRLQDIVGLATPCTGNGGHDRQLELRSCVDRPLLPGNLSPAIFGGKELAIGLDRLAQLRRGRNLHLVHPKGDQVGTERFAVQLDVQQPVVIWIFVTNGAINKVVAIQIIVAEQLFDGKGIAAGHPDHACVAQLNFIQPVLKLALLVVPEDDAALVIVRQRCCKAIIQIQCHFFTVHYDAPLM